MDRSVEPCQDFFQYACGAWLRENPVPADQVKWWRFSELDEHTRAVLRALLAQAAAEKDQTSTDARKTGDYYAACMDEPAIEAKGLAPLRPELERIAALKDKAELPAELAHLREVAGFALFSLSSAQDYTDAAQEIAQADQGGFALPDRDYYLLDDFKDERAAYVRHLGRMFGLLGDAPDRAAAEAATVMKVETALAKAAMGRVERREPKNIHHKMTLEAFTRLAPSFGWKEYLAAAQTPAFASLDVSDPGFFKGLEEALQTFSIDEWKTYLRWSLLNGVVAMLPKDFVAEDFDFFGKKLGGQQELKARWKRCVELTDAGLGEALGQAYVASEFPPQAKERVLAMVRAIEKAMAADIRSSPWMSQPTKLKALEKLAALANKIG